MKNVGLYDKDLSVPRKKDLDEKQPKITVDGILQGDGNGNVSAAQTVNGETIELNAALPTVTTADNGKFLRVVMGAWAAATVDNANGGAF